jgi:phage shock protein C
MSFSDEMAKLAELRDRGTLTEEEFAQAKTRLLKTGAAVTMDPLFSGLNALRRSSTNRWIAGVCGGLAKVTPMESWLWRLLIVLLTIFGGAGLILYILMWVFVPQD